MPPAGRGAAGPYHTCRNCMGEGQVCENHPDQAWNALGCECGAGMPCPVCQPDWAVAGYVVRIVQWLESQAANASAGTDRELLLDIARRIEAGEYLTPEQRERIGDFIPPRWTWFQ